MNAMTVQISKNPLHLFRILCCVQRFTQNLQHVNVNPYTTTVDAIDIFTKEILLRHRYRTKNNPLDVNNSSVRFFADSESTQKDIKDMTIEELDEIITHNLTKNKDKNVINLLKECTEYRKRMTDITLKKLFRNYSITGKPDVIDLLQKYSSKVDPYSHRRNGEFMHFLAKAQCMRGNSEKGLSILMNCYKKNEQLRSFYRIILRELIQDSVLNRSEASLVIFKKYVLEFSEKFGDHYPLICFWHLCWSSSWFSDQMLSNELLESSTKLQEILQERATAFSITILRQEYNEDAVLRLLQILLKYQMMQEYVKVLQVLFGYKLKNRDIRGCTEIIKNCENLGVALPSDQQGRYIRMLIDGSQKPDSKSSKPSLKNFKLKF